MVGAVLLGAVLAACSSKADRLQTGLVKGAEYVRLAAWDKAGVEVRNVLQIDPRNAQAHYLAGQVAEGRLEWQRAYASYLKAVDLKADHLDAKVGLARLQLLSGETAMAEKTVDELLALDARNVGARTLRAAIVARGGDVTAAIAQAQALLAERQPAPVEVTTLLAGLHVSRGDQASALAVLEDALKAAPRDLSLLRVAAQVAGSASAPRMPEKTDDFFRRATAEAPRSTELWNAWAAYQLQQGSIDASEAILRASLKAQPEDKPRTQALLAFLSAQRPVAVAETAYNAAIQASPKEPSLRLGLAALYRAKDRPDDARRVLREVAAGDKEAPGLEARNLLAADLWQGGQGTAARQLVDEVLAASPRDNAALILRSKMAMARNEAASAVIDLRTVARDQPGSLEVAGLLAQAHRRAGDPQLAREVISDAVNARPDNADLHLLLAADMADAREFKPALAEIDAALRLAPRSARAYEMKAQLFLAQKDPAGAERVLQAYRAQSPGVAAPGLLLGQFYAEQRRFDAALKEFDALAAVEPASPTPAVSAVAVLVAQRRFDEAEARIAALESRQPALLVQRLRGEVAVARGDLAAAERAYRRAIELSPQSTGGYAQLARLYVGRSRLDDGLSVLKQGESIVPQAMDLPRIRAEVLTASGRIEDAIAVYETLVRRAPDDDALANNLAYLLIERRGDKASLERAQALMQRFADSSNPVYLDTLGWGQYRLGQHAQAVPVLQRAVQLAPTAPLLQLHLGLALHKSGDPQQARAYLRQAVASKLNVPDLDEARLALARAER
jgi:predicted Zn-dependent protease